MSELGEIKKLLDARLWFIHLPLVERVRLLCEQYCQQQAIIDDLHDDLREERNSNRAI